MRSIISKAMVLGVVLGSASALAGTPDGFITSKTKLSLWTTGGLKSSAVHVDTNEGQVTLYGKVPTAEQKALAEKTAMEIKGVREVKNLLQVVAEPDAKQVARADKEIKEQVEKSLKDDLALHDSSISVKSVDKGVVLLSGKAATFDDQLAAVIDTDLVPGVRRVATEIEAPQAYGSEERSVFVSDSAPTARAEMNKPGVEPASSLTDTRITAAVKLRLLTTAYVPSTEINVDTNNRVVTLFGIVPTEAAKAGAAAEAMKVANVRKIDNDLQVVPSTKKEMVDAKDKDLEKELQAAFKKRPELKSVTSEVKNGVVRLTGTVDSGWDRLLAVRVARQCAGVRSVDEAMTIRGSTEAKRQF
jgi:osmotically-inducible protein OsmY